MFVLADIKWGTPVIGTSGGNVQWNSDLTTGLNYEDRLYELEDFEDALRDAFQAWEDVADINFVETNQEAEIEVGMKSLAGSTVGLAELQFFDLSGTDQFVGAELSMDSNETWAPFGETDLNFYAVAAHEIGHALGLLHVDDDTQIMNAELFVDDLAEGDIDGAEAIYGEKPPSVLQTDDDTLFAFFERFFNLVLSLFGISTGSSADEVASPPPWIDTDGPSLGDVIDITDLIGDEPGDLITIVHAVPHPDSDHVHDHDHDHGHGCTCLGCAFEAELAQV
ncbi:MAG: matrixin family metalloprotease [Pseudomonadota bacterium]